MADEGRCQKRCHPLIKKILWPGGGGFGQAETPLDTPLLRPLRNCHVSYDRPRFQLVRHCASSPSCLFATSFLISPNHFYCGLPLLLVLLFIVINIVLPRFILPRVAPVGRILFMHSRINNQSINQSINPCLPRHIYHHHYFARIFFFSFSSQYIPILLQTAFLYSLGYFSHRRYPSHSFIPYSAQLG